ncbi:GNAT family N-acetyltransferase, partial [Streptomyces erythrochromogenes]
MQALPTDHWPSFYTAVLSALCETEPQEATDLWRTLAEPQRCFVVEDRGAFIGTASLLSLRMTVPGGRLVDTGGSTMVSVQPTHRGRGVLDALMRHQLASLQRRGVPLAALTASEAPGCGRFGYGVAARQLSLDVASSRVRIAGHSAGGDAVELTVEDPHESLGACEEFYARQVPLRPGMLARTDGWELLPLLDPPAWRQSASPLRCVVAWMEGEVVGYARYAVAVGWSRTNLAEGVVRVRDIEARDPGTYATLWRFLLETELTSRVIAPDRPVDEPVLHLASDIRHCTPTVLDNLYLRVVDAPVALTARTYATGLDVVMEIHDDLAPWNRGCWRIEGDAGGAVCTRTYDAPDLSLDASALGSAYLGGVTLTELAGAGRVREHRPGALTTTTTAFASAVAPW